MSEPVSSEACLLAVRDLRVAIGTPKKRIPILHGVGFTVHPGECLSLVGESGCGKTLTALSITRLIKDYGGIIEKGSILFHGQDLVKMSERSLRSIRGRKIAMIFQDPLSALNPYLRISIQLMEGLRHHTSVSEKDALKKGIRILEEVGIPDAGKRVHDYPHQFSGGMRQRIMIAMALMTSPDLIIADEPTSALDVTLQAQTLRILDALRKSYGTAVILITHDLGVVAGRSDRIAVMYAGRIVESGGTARALKNPLHPYLESLLRSNPSLDTPRGGKLKEIPGQPPTPEEIPRGCAFAPRCPMVFEKCKKENPPLLEVEEGHSAACWLSINPG